MTTRDRFPALYSGPTPAWDIGRPQPELLVAFDELALTGSVLDLGCGTGENTLELARRGLEAWGLDATPAALAIAEKKRAARGLAATFVLGDALDLATNPGGPGPRGYSVEELRAAFDKGYREVFVRSASFWATSERGHKTAWLSLFIREGLGRQ